MSSVATSLGTGAFSRAQMDSHLDLLDLHFDDSNGCLWYFINQNATTYYSRELLAQIREVQRSVDEVTALPCTHYAPEQVKYVVFGSRLPGVFGYGGDLQLFHDLIQNRDRPGLSAYARLAADAVFHHASNSRRITTISLVQGEALGGGFEAALAANVLVAERGARMGFPEVLFGLFPGMGGYTFLRRRISAADAESMIVDANIHTAEELYEMGIVDVLAEPGEGEYEIDRYIRRIRNHPGSSAFRGALNRVKTVDHAELYGISEAWVDAAMELEPRYLGRMEKLIRKQRQKTAPRFSPVAAISAHS